MSFKVIPKYGSCISQSSPKGSQNGLRQVLKVDFLGKLIFKPLFILPSDGDKNKKQNKVSLN